MQRYEKYKDSGVDWIGEIPEHWKVVKLKYIFKILKRIAGSEGFDVLSITQRGIKVKDVTSGEGQLAMDYAKYQFCYVNDFAMNHMDLLTGWVDLSNFDGVISPDYRVFDLIRNDCSKPYLLTLLQLCYTNKVFYAHGQGVSMLGRWRFPSENFNNFYFPIPRIEEQFKIVSFLDDKTAKIDQTIANKQKEIELLKERRQILIQKAVTKGLDDTVKLKDSGVDWIGEIPEHWVIETFKNILTERNKKNYPIKSRERLSLSIDKGVTLYSEKTTNLDRFKDDFTQYKLAYEGDLVFNSMNMIVGAVGVSNYFGCISPVYYTYYSASNNFSLTKFFEYMFKTRLIQGVLYSLGRGIMVIDRGEGKFNTVRLKVPRSDLRSLKLPLPKLNDQEKIVSYLEEIEEKIDKAILLKQQEIEKLKEYKTVLIDNVVTGKVRVS